MNPNRIVGAALVVGGLILLYFGLRASDTVSESVREGLTGRFSDKTTWYIVGGALITIAGAGMAFFSPRSSRV